MTAYVFYIPPILTLSLVVWTAVISPYSKYVDYAAIVPALLVLPIVFLVNIFLIVKLDWKFGIVLYGVLHLALLLPIWFWCLMRISKDTL